jgi:hypothetical protein
MVSVEHGSVGTFSDNSLVWVLDGLVHIFGSVNNHIICHHSFVNSAQLVKFLSLIEVIKVELVLNLTDEMVILFEE